MTGRGRRARKVNSGVLVAPARNGSPALVRSKPLGPELPAVRPDNDQEWQPSTERIYESVRRSPVASRYLDSDWLILQNLMLLQDDFFVRSRGRAILAAELRQEYAQLGLTPAARAALKWSQDDRAVTDAGPAGSGGLGREAQARIDESRDRFFVLMGERRGA